MKIKKIKLNRKIEKRLLALGCDLDGSVCFAQDDEVVLAGGMGDLKEPANLDSYAQKLQNLLQKEGFVPEILLCDLNENQESAKYAQRLSNIYACPLVQAQHQEAHFYGSLLENQVDLQNESVLGVVFDDIGMGIDEYEWGGEFFMATHRDLQRFAHFAYWPMPGGAYVHLEPYRMMLSAIWQAFGDVHLDGLFKSSVQNNTFQGVWELLKKDSISTYTTSVKLILDAVYCLTGGKTSLRSRYQGLESLAKLLKKPVADVGAFPFEIISSKTSQTISLDLAIQELVNQLAAGESKERIAQAFIETLSQSVLQTVDLAFSKAKQNKVTLTGQVLDVPAFRDKFAADLIQHGCQVLPSSSLGSSDGSLAWGQVAYAVYQELDLA